MYKEISYYLEITNNKKYKSLLHNSELYFYELIAFFPFSNAYDFVFIEVGDDKNICSHKACFMFCDMDKEYTCSNFYGV